jgi:hypothetical protein
MPEDIRANPLEWGIKVVPVLSALSFGVSGMLNALLFWSLWGVNYFQVATPSDVIMSAFLFASVTALGTAVAYLWHRYVHPILNRQFDRVLYPLIERLLPKKYRGIPRQPQSRFDELMSLTLTAMCVTTVLVSIGVRQGSPFWFSSGLEVAEAVVINGEDCGGASVRWLGSSAAVLDCAGSIVVLHKLDDLITTPVQPRNGKPELSGPRPLAAAPAPPISHKPGPPQAGPAEPTSSQPSALASSPTVSQPPSEALR